MAASEAFRQAHHSVNWTDKPYETWMYEARKVKPTKLFMVIGKNFLNKVKEEFQPAVVTTHKLSEAKKFATHWEVNLGMTDIKIFETALSWNEVEG